MAEHAWIIENVDGGPVGDCDFWTCSTCGVGGGPVLPQRSSKTFFGEERSNGRWPAFFPGSGLKVSEDCEEAQAQIRSYLLDKRIAPMRKKWCKPHAEILAKVVQEAPEGKSLMPILNIILRIEMPVLSKKGRGHCMSLAELREALTKAGFEP